MRSIEESYQRITDEKRSFDIRSDWETAFADQYYNIDSRSRI